MASQCPCECGRRLGWADSRAAQSGSAYLRGLPSAWRAAKLLELAQSDHFHEAHEFLVTGLIGADRFFATVHARADRDRTEFARREASLPSVNETAAWSGAALDQVELMTLLDEQWLHWWTSNEMPMASLHGALGAQPRSLWREGDAWSRVAWDGEMTMTPTAAPPLPVAEVVAARMRNVSEDDTQYGGGSIEFTNGTLGQSIDAHARCVYLGSATPPEGPVGPGFQGVALAGPSMFGFVNPKRSTTMCWQSGTYNDISAVCFRGEEDDAGNGSWLVEFVKNEGHKPYLKRDGDFIQHIAVRLPAPAVLGSPNVTDVILTRVRQLSRFDLTDRFGPEGNVPGMLLLPITPELEI